MIVSVTMVKNLFTGFPFLKLALFQPLLNDYRFPSCKGALNGLRAKASLFFRSAAGHDHGLPLAQSAVFSTEVLLGAVEKKACTAEESS